MRLALAACLLSATAAQAFEPGTHGEPVEEEGYFVGCAEPEAGGGCAMHARGAVWVAWHDGPSDKAALKVLAGMKQGDPVKFTGDMLSMGDVTVDLVLNTAAPNPEDPLAPLVASLQGTWTKDAGAEVIIEGLEWVEVETASYLISLGNACSDGADRGKVHLSLYQMGGDPFSSICLEVVETSETQITLRDAATGAEVALTR
jgi:hypothetical protein